MQKQIRLVPSSRYSKVIEVTAPIRFYWVDGKYDGLGFGPFWRPLSRGQKELIYDVLDGVGKSRTEIPQVFVEAFDAK